MNKKISRIRFLTMVSAVIISCETAPKEPTQTKITSNTKAAGNKNMIMGKVAMKNWFGMNANQLKRQVKDAKDVYGVSGTDKSLIGLESKENWFGKNIRVFYSLSGENITLNQIVLTYENPNYEALIKKMTENLGEPVSSQTFENTSPSIQSTEFLRNGLHFNVVDYSTYVDIYITPAD